MLPTNSREKLILPRQDWKWGLTLWVSVANTSSTNWYCCPHAKALFYDQDIVGFSRACDFSDCSASIVLRVDGMLDVGNNDLRHHENALKLVFILFIILYAGLGGGGVQGSNYWNQNMQQQKVTYERSGHFTDSDTNHTKWNLYFRVQ